MLAFQYPLRPEEDYSSSWKLVYNFNQMFCYRDHQLTTRFNQQNEKSTSKNLTISIPQGSCSGANLFSCYCSLIITAIPNSLDVNGFAGDHSIRTKYKASNTIRAWGAKKMLENTLNNTKEWMDSMRLKLNWDKTEYIQFRSRQQVKKIDTSPINANGDLIPWAPVYGTWEDIWTPT